MVIPLIGKRWSQKAFYRDLEIIAIFHGHLLTSCPFSIESIFTREFENGLFLSTILWWYFMTSEIDNLLLLLYIHRQLKICKLLLHSS